MTRAMMMESRQGVTLLEIMVASVISVVIIFGLVLIEGTRARVSEGVRQGILAEPDRKNAALAAIQISKSLENADRLNLVPATGVYQMRTLACPTTPPQPACFDDVTGTTYQWTQYRLNGTDLRLYQFARPPAGCPPVQVVAKEITALSITSNGNNGAGYSVTWTSAATPTRTQAFQGQVTTRLLTEASTPFGLQNPALGDISPPPAACP